MPHGGFLRLELGLSALVIATSASAGCARAGMPEAWQAQCAPGSYVPESLDRWFRLTSDVTRGRGGPQVEGYVYNHFGAGAERMRLAVARVDASEQAIDCVTISVNGTVPPAGRAYFVARVPDAGARYRVRILSFDWASKGGP